MFKKLLRLLFFYTIAIMPVEYDTLNTVMLFKIDIRDMPMAPVGPENYDSFVDGLSKEDAWRKIAEGSIPLAISIANLFQGRAALLGIPFSDLLQEALLELFVAARHYNHEKGCQFSTFAFKHIKGHLQTVLANERRIPYASDVSLFEETTSDFGQHPEEQTFDFSQNPEDIAVASERKQLVQDALGKLGSDELGLRQKELIEWNFGLNNKPQTSQAAIGRELGYTRSNVNHFVQLGIKKLRGDTVFMSSL